MTIRERIERLEAEVNPTGMLLQPWGRLPDGAMFTDYLGHRHTQGRGEDPDAFLARCAGLIPRRPLLWVSPVDAAI